MTYKYIAYTTDRRVVEGTVDAGTEDEAKARLRQSGYGVVSLKEARAPFSIRQSMPSLFGVKPREVAIFSRQLATLIERGINVFSALPILRDQARNPVFRDVLTEMIRDLEGGSSFADAMGRHPQAFPPLYSRMLRVGETTGSLHEVLRRVAEYVEKEQAALKRVKGAMVYPALILLLSCGVIAILFTFTVPSLIGVFDEFEADLPLVTSILITTVDLVKGYGPYIVPLTIVVLALALRYARTGPGRERLDVILWRLPIIGSIVSQREMARFSRTMSLSLDSGLPMTDAMDLVIQTAGNSAARKALEDIRARMIDGQSLSLSMASNGLFPPLLVQMAKVGEQVGTLSPDLATVADLYEQEIDERVEMLLSLMQPLLILILGLIVGFIAISVILPIYSAMGSI